MGYKYSKHIMQRMAERNISKDEIEAILNKQVSTLTYPSKKDASVDLIMGITGNKSILIAVNKKTSNLITVRSMSEKERKLFWQEEF